MKIRYRYGGETEVGIDSFVIGRAPDGNFGQRLLGFSITETPDVGDYPESYYEPAFYHAKDVDIESGRNLYGYFAQFMEAGGGMYGWSEPIEDVTW